MASLKANLDGALDWGAVLAAARPRVQMARENPAPFWDSNRRCASTPTPVQKALL